MRRSCNILKDTKEKVHHNNNNNKEALLVLQSTKKMEYKKSNSNQQHYLTGRSSKSKRITVYKLLCLSNTAAHTNIEQSIAIIAYLPLPFSLFLFHSHSFSLSLLQFSIVLHSVVCIFGMACVPFHVLNACYKEYQSICNTINIRQCFYFFFCSFQLFVLYFSLSLIFLLLSFCIYLPYFSFFGFSFVSNPLTISIRFFFTSLHRCDQLILF